MPKVPRSGVVVDRRHFLRSAGLIAAAAASAGHVFAGENIVMPFLNGQRQLVKYPQKRPLIRLTTRPPQLETPFSVFNEGVITPNDAFFVRYHLANIPLSIDSETFRVEVKGSVETPLSLSLADLKKMEAVELVGVLQCSGNSRGFSQPRVGGGQLGNGAMGNAKWRGVRLKDILEKAKLKPTAKQVAFNGLDKAPLDKTPDFVKALDVDHALDGEVMLAYEMNGEALPMLNGYPLRLIVPGYFGTYWVKHVNEITVMDEVLNNFWMNPAYRIPDNGCGFVEAGTTPAKTTPIKRYNVRSFITNVTDGAMVKTGEPLRLKGIAFDGGYGIREVLISTDGARSWVPAKLGNDLGKYSFREWEASFTPSRPGKVELKVRAVNRVGESQPLEALWNPPGYMRNVVETVNILSA
ncbi:MAG: oxidase [Verrucomicrobiales bacterium]|nr:oxidase [Verrucomicrobiales bacterium]